MKWISVAGLFLLTAQLGALVDARDNSRESASEVVVGYLGASNDTTTSTRILNLLLGHELVTLSATPKLHSEAYGSLTKLDEGRGAVSVVHRVTDKCDVGVAIQNLFDLLHNEKNLVALIVYSCTEVLKVIGELAAVLNLLVLGMGSSSGVLRNTDKYPTLQLLTEVENTHSDARVAFVEAQGWRKVVTLAEHYEDYTLAAENFYDTAINGSKIKVDESMTLVSSHVDINSKIDLLNDNDRRIIFLFGSQRVLEDLLLAMASKPEFLKARRVIISNQYIPKVPSDLELFYIGTSFNQGIKSSAKNRHANTIRSLITQLQHFLRKIPESIVGANQTKTYFTANFAYRGNFSTSVYQYNQLSKQYNLLVATRLNKTNWREILANITWTGGAKPLDSKREVIIYNEINSTALYIFCSLSGLGTVIALVFLIINLRYKHVSMIKMSSPLLNCMNIIGAVFLYTSVCLMGLGYPRLDKITFKTTCVVRNFLLSIGYSLVFGPMCAKTYRVHYIFTSVHQGKVSRKKLSDTYLLLFTAGLVMVDVVFLVCWNLTDPFEIHEIKTHEPEKCDIDTDVYSLSSTCSSHSMTKWLGVVYAYKGAILIFGVYLAWTTRNVSIPTLNDSKSIMLNIYIVLFASVLVVITSLFLRYDATLSYSIVGCLVFVSTTTMLAILFIPKIVSLWKTPAMTRSHTHKASVVMRGTGLIACNSNTKRLAVDHSENIREMEIQCKVLQSEAQQLEAELTKLTMMSTQPSLPLSDLLTEDLLYILPLPLKEEDLIHDPFSYKLTRKHTPKYKIKRQLQKELLQQMKTNHITGGNRTLIPLHNTQQRHHMTDCSPKTQRKTGHRPYQTVHTTINLAVEPSGTDTEPVAEL